MKNNKFLFSSLGMGLLLMLTLAFGCSPQQKPEQAPSYSEMKNMMMDIVNSDDFKKNLAKMMQQPDFQQLSVAGDPQFKETVNNVMRSSDFRNILLENMNAPDFKTGLQKSMLEVMQGPDFKREFSLILADEIRRNGGMGTNGGGQGQGQNGGQGGGQGGGSSR